MFYNIFSSGSGLGHQFVDVHNNIGDVVLNIQRGELAMQFVIDTHSDFTHAMYRQDLGWIDFVWGDVGIVKASGKTKGGKGVAHILEARQRKDGLTTIQAKDLALKLVEVIAKGKVIRQNTVQGTTTKTIQFQKYEATLVKDGAKNEWLLTGYEII